MNLLKKIALFVLPVVLASCSKDPDVENTTTVNMAGEWYVRYYAGGSAINPYFRTLTYNAADPSGNQVWVDDEKEWPLKAKFNVDYKNLAFTSTSTINISDSSETVKLIEGKVLPKAGRSKTGVVVDSIYLKLEFTSDPGTEYELKGHQRTGFFEDEY
jgi:hypothetical protein